MTAGTNEAADRSLKGKEDMNMVELLAKEFNADNWRSYSMLFPESELKVENIPQDIVNTLVGILGEKQAIDWMQTELSCIDNMTVPQLVATEKGRRALKALIMRLPT